MSLSNPPEVALWLTVPDTCRMRTEFEVGDYDLPDIHVILGSDDDETRLLFEREALERFVELAQRMLGVPITPDSRIPPTLLESNHGYEIREKPPKFAVASEPAEGDPASFASACPGRTVGAGG